MTQYKRKLLSVLASGALLANIATPVLAGTTIEISGNGSSSDNEAKVEVKSERTVVQTNDAYIVNNVKTDANTGNNDANDNTGGDVTIDTGDADVSVDVSNSVNSNTASVDCCPTGDTNVLIGETDSISGNGTKSDNKVVLEQKSETNVFQSNDAYIKNDVDVDADTGNNDAEDNTGGDVTIETGDADVEVSAATWANANWALVGGNGGSGGSLSARILGNGSNSDNEIKLKLKKEIAVVQENEAYVKNDIDVDADTGNNDANDNTGGDVSIKKTGDADVNVEVDNMVNFNWADVDCGCLLGVLAKISGNGTDSDNDIKAELKDELEVFQDNCGDDKKEWGWWHKKGCKIDNDVDADADTGNNDAEDNTGGVNGGDPSIETGDSDTDIEINNSGNVNAYGADEDPDFPEFNFNFNLSLDWSDLLELLGLL